MPKVEVGKRISRQYLQQKMGDAPLPLPAWRSGAWLVVLLAMTAPSRDLWSFAAPARPGWPRRGTPRHVLGFGALTRLRLRGGAGAEDGVLPRVDTAVATVEEQALAEAEAAAALAGDDAAAEEVDESAASNDRGELHAPYYDGVRVTCLFVHGNTKEEQWCSGTIVYTKRSTRELRIVFDEVPEWESSTRLFWPIDDVDIKVLPDQEGGPRLNAEERRALSEKMLHCAEMLDWPQVRRAVWFGADALAADSIGQTVLHLAALAGDTATVKEVVQRSTNKAALLNLETKEGNTPLHYAAMSEDTAVLRQLLRAGANMAAKNKYGNLPLHLSEAAGNAAGYPL